MTSSLHEARPVLLDLEQLYEEEGKPDLERVLAKVENMSARHMLEALLFDQSRRWQKGEAIEAQVYLDRLPALREDEERAFALVYAEFLLRKRWGQGQSLRAFQLRYPSFAEWLRQQIELGELFDHSASVSTGIGAARQRFEQALVDEQRPRIEDYLALVSDEERVALLQMLVTVEIDHRCRRHDTPLVREYLDRFSALEASWLQGIVDNVLSTQTPPAFPRPRGRARRIRCPHCKNPIELVDDRPEGVLCPGCGNSFRMREARTTESVGDLRMGKFQLLERVGSGGFGAVWRARDTDLGRVVALKIPHTGLSISDDELRHFRDEARKAAQLRHPGIVSVHEVADVSGLPVIVSDFIQGVTLKDYLEVRRPTFMEAAHLVAEIADILHYAHDKGLVHLDVKPANIMIEEPQAAAVDMAANGTTFPGKPHVLDFGLALRQEPENATMLEGQLIGTVAFMSPEQAARRVDLADRRSDVFSLGVVLYELLCGELPFRGSRDMILWQIRHEDPREPRRINDTIPRDLEKVCLKALAKGPGNRYQSAAALADDLRRFLRGEPVKARRAGKVEHCWRWCRRNPRMASLAAAVALLLAIVAISSTVFAFLVDSQYRRAEINFQRAEDHFSNTLGAVDMLTAALDQILVDVPALEKRPQDYLMSLQPLLDRLLEEEQSEPRRREQLALALHRVGKLHSKMMTADGTTRGHKAFERAISELRQLVRREPDNLAYRLALASCHNDFAELLRSTRSPQARAHYDAAVSQLRSLLSREPARTSVRQELARALNNIGILLFNEDGNMGAAIQAYEEGARLLRQAQDPALQDDLARICLNLGVALFEQARTKDGRGADDSVRLFAAAEARYSEGIFLLERLGEQHPTGPETLHKLATLYQNLGNLHLQLGDRLDQETFTATAASIPEKLIVAQADPYLVCGTLWISFPWKGVLRRQEAEKRLRQAVDIFRRLNKDFPGYHLYQDRLVVALHNLGVLLKKTGRPEEARSSWLAACAHGKATAALAERHEYQAHLADALCSLGELHYRRGEYTEALGEFEKALPHRRAAYRLANKNADYRQRLGQLYGWLAYTCCQLGKPADACEFTEQRAQLFPDNADVAFGAACFVSTLMGMTRAKHSLRPDDRERHLETYAAAAAGFLGRALQRGLSPNRLNDARLAHFRSHRSFRAFQEEVAESIHVR